MVYDNRSNRDLNIRYGERSLELSKSAELPLVQGVNHLLIKSETTGRTWRVYLQPTPENGAILREPVEYPKQGLGFLPDIDSTVGAVSNWLVLGPLPGKDGAKGNTGLNTQVAPGENIRFGEMYEGLAGPVTWSIPRVEVLGDVIDAKDWGTNYNWNYHNGGVAWAMQQLGELTATSSYGKYADDFCNFHLNGKPFVEYQVKTLNAFNSANSLFINTPLLDFTLAPSLPYVYKLRTQEKEFANRQAYTKFVDSMIVYASKVQLRLPGAGIFTRTTPRKYTTWVDDMFMGIPFLVQASLLSSDAAQRKRLMDDAANQVLGFNKQVFDESCNLYVHAKYSESDVKLPHWSRANGWGIWATTEVLLHLNPADKRYNEILAHYRKHVAALAALQHSSGFWLNVLDRKDSPKEVSGTAIFTMAIARGIRIGWLDSKTFMPVAMRGWEALKSQVEADGTVHNICMGTMCSEDVQYYINRPFYDNDTHGLFAVLFACIELEKLQQMKAPVK
jgi:rhamnogalacturonyl hydrolase YesR